MTPLRAGLAVLLALPPAAAWGQSRAVARLAPSGFGFAAPVPALSRFTGSLTPQTLSILPAPSLTPPALQPALQASPIVEALQAGPGPAPVTAEQPKAPQAQEAIASAMTVQGAVLGSIARATGFDPLVISLGMAAVRGGFTVADWNALGARLQALDSDWEEIDQVLSSEMRSQQFSEGFRQGKKISPDDLMTLKGSIQYLPEQVEVSRNNRFLDWRYRWEAGDASAAGASFRDGSVKRVSPEAWQIDWGAAPGPGGAQRLRVTLHELSGMPADAKPQLDALLASPLLTAEQRADLAALAGRIEAAGLLPAGYNRALAPPAQLPGEHLAQVPGLPAFLSVADAADRAWVESVLAAAMRSRTGRRVLKRAYGVAARRGHPIPVQIEELRTDNGSFVYDWDVLQLARSLIREDTGEATPILVHELLHFVQREIGLPVDALEMELEAHVVTLQVFAELGLRPGRGTFSYQAQASLRRGGAEGFVKWLNRQYGRNIPLLGSSVDGYAAELERRAHRTERSIREIESLLAKREATLAEMRAAALSREALETYETDQVAPVRKRLHDQQAALAWAQRDLGILRTPEGAERYRAFAQRVRKRMERYARSLSR